MVDRTKKRKAPSVDVSAKLISNKEPEIVISRKTIELMKIAPIAHGHIAMSNTAELIKDISNLLSIEDKGKWLINRQDIYNFIILLGGDPLNVESQLDELLAIRDKLINLK